jgi:deoxyribodipyrimidine photo-lyase
MATADAIFWFRFDLRLHDHPGLSSAIEQGRVVPLFIWSPEEEGTWPLGGASRWWLHHSLASLAETLARRGAPLVLRRGPALEVLRRLLEETGAKYVAWSRRYEPTAIARDTSVKQALQLAGVTAESFNGSLLNEPWSISTKAGGPCKVFTPYWRTCLRGPEPRAPLAAPRRIAGASAAVDSLPLDDLELLPQIDWAGGMRSMWKPGEQGAQAQLKRFVSRALDEYIDGRNRIDMEGSSQLSPYLRFGALSPQQVWHAVQAAAPGGPTARESRDCYLSEIGWREFSYHLLYHFPHTTDAPLRESFAQFPWENDPQTLRRWQRGQTGVPVVDAALRHLWHSGWMPNRARMIVASYLTKNLLVPWQAGARWFWDTLVDADLASNTQGWQWTAGCGADAAPYFRIFNPVSQAEKFDPEGAYVRRWVPELARLPARWLPRPWEAPAETLAAAGVRLGRDYPHPLVDLGESRQRALSAYQTIKNA